MLFKRKRDFKPDSTGKGLLSKLYLTPRQRLTILKWTLFGLCLLVLVRGIINYVRLRKQDTAEKGS